MDKDDIKKRIEKLEELNKFAETIIKNQPQINLTLKTLSIIEKEDLPQEVFNVYTNSFETIDNLSSDNYSNDAFNTMSAQSLSATSIASGLIYSGYQNVPSLMNVYNNIKKLSDDISLHEQIIEKIDSIHNKKLRELYDIAYQSYNSFKNELNSDTDLAKDMRNFIEYLKGIINKPRIIIDEVKPNRNRDKFSWPRMVKHIHKPGSYNEAGLMEQKEEYERLHKYLSPALKSTSDNTEDDLERNYIAFTAFTFSVLSYIDIDKLNKYLDLDK